MIFEFYGSHLSSLANYIMLFLVKKKIYIRNIAVKNLISKGLAVSWCLKVKSITSPLCVIAE